MSSVHSASCASMSAAAVPCVARPAAGRAATGGVRRDGLSMRTPAAESAPPPARAALCGASPS
eukprot:5531244-Prymnesium_polylepis.1